MLKLSLQWANFVQAVFSTANPKGAHTGHSCVSLDIAHSSWQFLVCACLHQALRAWEKSR